MGGKRMLGAILTGVAAVMLAVAMTTLGQRLPMSAQSLDATQQEPSGQESSLGADASESGSVRPASYPGPETTGVPDGIELTRSDGIDITGRGKVIEGLEIEGAVNIYADDVVLRNSRVVTADSNYPIHIHPGVTGVLIENVEVSNAGRDGKGIYFNRSSGTVRRANVHSSEDGIFITGDNVVIEESYVHHLVDTHTSHSDAIQIRQGNNIMIRNNNLQAYNQETGEELNAALQIGSLLDGEPIEGLQVLGNLMNGGNVTINGGRDGNVIRAVYRGNRFGDDFQYGIVGNLPADTDWDETNVMDRTGEPVR